MRVQICKHAALEKLNKTLRPPGSSSTDPEEHLPTGFIPEAPPTRQTIKTNINQQISPRYETEKYINTHQHFTRPILSQKHHYAISYALKHFKEHFCDTSPKHPSGLGFVWHTLDSLLHTWSWNLPLPVCQWDQEPCIKVREAEYTAKTPVHRTIE